MAKTRVFISYAREDLEAASTLCRQLETAGLDPWLDRLFLRPGEKWKVAISAAIRESRFFLALLSSRSVKRKGFVHAEVAAALDVLDEYPESDVFLIPVRLDPCLPSHERLNELHWVNMFPSWAAGLHSLLNVLIADPNARQNALNALAIETPTSDTQVGSKVDVSTLIHEIAQPAFMALTSIEFLRRRDAERGHDARTDTLDYYVKQNLEAAIRIVAFYNDMARCSRNTPSYSPVLLSDIIGNVLLPIVRLVKHQRLATHLNTRQIKLTPGVLGEPVGREQGEVNSWDIGIGDTYAVECNTSLNNIRLYVDTYRLQEVFYAVIVRYLLARRTANALGIAIRPWKNITPESAAISGTKAFHIISVEEMCPAASTHAAAGTRDEHQLKQQSQSCGTDEVFPFELVCAREVMLGMGGDLLVADGRIGPQVLVFVPIVCGTSSWVEEVASTRGKMAAIRERMCPPWKAP